jgi:hypothetical protein
VPPQPVAIDAIRTGYWRMQRHELSPQKLALLKRLLHKQGIDSVNLPFIPLQRTGERTQMSLAQAQLWVAHRLDPESPAYNVHFSVALPAALSDVALAAALQATRSSGPRSTRSPVSPSRRCTTRCLRR